MKLLDGVNPTLRRAERTSETQPTHFRRAGICGPAALPEFPTGLPSLNVPL
jgi:hypothetical protein